MAEGYWAVCTGARFFSPVRVEAWRIARLMRLGRRCPDLDAALLCERDEWQAANILNRKNVPQCPTKLKAVVRLVAMLGGFLARKGDGELVVKTIWLGLQRVLDLAGGIRQPFATLRGDWTEWFANRVGETE